MGLLWNVTDTPFFSPLKKMHLQVATTKWFLGEGWEFVLMSSLSWDLSDLDLCTTVSGLCRQDVLHLELFTFSGLTVFPSPLSHGSQERRDRHPIWGQALQSLTVCTFVQLLFSISCHLLPEEASSLRILISRSMGIAVCH